MPARSVQNERHGYADGRMTNFYRYSDNDPWLPNEDENGNEGENEGENENKNENEDES